MARQRLMFAGDEGGGQRLFEWDGSAVRERLDDLALQPVVQHLVYDRVGQRMLALSTDRWVGAWSGGPFVWSTSSSAPPSNVTTSVAFDEFRRRLVVVSGVGAVHEWDGVRWWQVGVVPVGGVEPGAAFGFDPISRRCILYGGASSVTAATWIWDGFAWALWSGSSAPGPRQNAALALDPGSGRLVMYGGSTTDTATWTWTGSAWTLRPTSTVPGPRSRLCLVPDEVGVTMVALDDAQRLPVWQLRTAGWQSVGDLPRWPEWRANVAFGFDHVRNTIVGFGGNQGGSLVPPHQTVVFDRGWRVCMPTTNPPLRHSAMLAWSDVDQRLLLFGGVYQGTTIRGDSWIWSGTDWEARLPTNQPPARYGAVMAPDPAGGVLLFGGFDGTNYLGDHWRWNGIDWLPQNPALRPLARAHAAYAQDPLRQRIVVCGGYSNVAAYDTETWVFDGSNWHQPATSSNVGSSPIVFWPARGRIVAPTTPHPKEWTGSDWVENPMLVMPPTNRQWVAHLGRGELLAFLVPTAVILTVRRGSVERFGSNCSLGVAPVLTALDVPAPGSPFAIELTARAAAAPTFLVVGLAADNLAIGSGCRSLVGLQTGVHLAIASGGGIARFPLPIPNDLGLRDAQFTVQGAVWQPAESPIGTATLTAGLRITVGD